MSLDFSFGLGSLGWSLVETLEGGYGNHKSTKGRWNNTKDIFVWKDMEGNLVAELVLTQGVSTIVDYDKLEKICKYNWCAARDAHWGYRVMAHTHSNSRVLLHQFLFGSEVGTVDHINTSFPNSYALDNRKNNIRITDKNTHNVRTYKSNTSGYPNIIITKSGKYNVQVTVNQKRPYTPYYEMSELPAAILCRDLFKVVLHKHKGHNITEEEYIAHKKLILTLYDKTKIAQTKTEFNILELFKQIKLKGTLDLKERLSSFR
tara:strand:+ start:2008 stop:2790 length:783 start_codon:yes stop_codon:yes gene_type:complete